MSNIPLAEQLRPQKIEEIVGQEHLLADGAFLSNIMASERLLSILLWGPPGCGKTSLARLYAKAFERRFVALSAAANSLSDVKKVIKEAQDSPLLNRNGIVLFLDEIHRFNKAQQDALLPPVEKGTVVLVGATTENPSFYLNDALLSRLRVLTLKSLSTKALEKLLSRSEEINEPLPLTDDAREKLLELAHGDGRYLLNMVENLRTLSDKSIDAELLCHHVQRRSALFDRSGDGHYNLISALHKSVRGSDPDAALYWFARILEGGEEPLFVARRLIRMASEDIGLADPNALSLAIAARNSFEMLGSPEGELALAQCVIYLALAPKSNATYTAYADARKKAAETRQLPPPKHILNAPTKLMKAEGYGKGYLYDHDTPNAFSGQQYFPEEMGRETFYHPQPRGFERDMQKRLDYFKGLRDCHPAPTR